MYVGQVHIWLWGTLWNFFFFLHSLPSVGWIHKCETRGYRGQTINLCLRWTGKGAYMAVNGWLVCMFQWKIRFTWTQTNEENRFHSWEQIFSLIFFPFFLLEWIPFENVYSFSSLLQYKTRCQTYFNLSMGFRTIVINAKGWTCHCPKPVRECAILWPCPIWLQAAAFLRSGGFWQLGLFFSFCC